MNNSVTRYLFSSISADLDLDNQFRLISWAFTSIFLSVLVVHQFLPGEQPLMQVLTHGFLIGLTFTLVAVALGCLLYALRSQISRWEFRVWHLWLMSFLVFNLGYITELPLNYDTRMLLHEDLAERPPIDHYLRLVPIWAIFTFIFIQVYTSQGLRDELEELRTINERLRRSAGPSRREARSDETLSEDTTLRLSGGKTISSSRISHISVDDHYCFIHFQTDEGWSRTEVARPLKSLLLELPATFIQIHRSHIVNPSYAVKVKREERNVLITMKNGDELPVSRSNKREVVSKMQQL